MLICGNGCETRFWFDLSSVYTVLTNVYGYQEGSVWDGFVNRRVIAMAPDLIRDKYKEDLFSSDLNGNGHEANADGTGDFFNWFDDQFTSYTKDNLHNIFRCFAGDENCLQLYAEEGLEDLRTLTEEDQLFIYITGHGKQDQFGCYFPVTEHNGGTKKSMTTNLLIG